MEEMETAWLSSTVYVMDIQSYCDWGIQHVRQLTDLM